jgi:hypothetical protein
MSKSLRNALQFAVTLLVAVALVAGFAFIPSRTTAQTLRAEVTPAVSHFGKAVHPSESSDRLSQVTSVGQLEDVSPSDPYFQALQSLIEKYGVDVSLPDGTFRGEQPITRGNFVIYLNRAMDRMVELMEN